MTKIKIYLGLPRIIYISKVYAIKLIIIINTTKIEKCLDLLKIVYIIRYKYLYIKIRRISIFILCVSQFYINFSINLQYLLLAF